MGPLLPEAWLQLLIGWLFQFGFLVAVVIVVVALLLRHRRPAKAELVSGSAAALAPQTVESQLLEIDQLLSQGRISADEHSVMRSRILDLR